MTDLAIGITLVPVCLLAFRIIKDRPELGVALALVPSLFFTEDLHENYWAPKSDWLWSLHATKLFGFLRPTEVIMIVLSLVLVSAYWNRWRLLRSDLNTVVVLLLVMCPAFALLSALRGADPVFALSYNTWRSFWWGMIFFFFCLHALDKDRVEHYFALLFYAIVARMGFGVAMFVLGYGQSHNIYPDTDIVFWDGLDLHLASSLAIISVCLLMDRTSPVARGPVLLGLVLSTITILFSLRRGPVANVVFGLAALVLVLPMKRKGRILGGSVLLVGVGGVLLLFFGEVFEGTSFDLVLERVGQVFATDLKTEHTFHLFDPLDHLVAILKDPIVGIGFGVPIERTFLQDEPTTFSHNAYLVVWGGLGIVGLLVYLMLYFRTLRLGRRAFVVSGGSMMVAGLIGIILTGLIQGMYATGNFTSSRMPFVLFFATALLVKISERGEISAPTNNQTDVHGTS